VHADGSRTTSSRGDRFRALRRVLVPVVAVLIFAGLIALVALSHRPAPPLGPAVHREK
jgi:hypothetical protein